MVKLLSHRIGWGIGLLYAVSLMFLVFQGGKTALMLFVMLNALGLYLLLGRWSGIGQVQGVRTVDESSLTASTVPAGTRLRIKLSLQIPGYWPLPYVIVRERLTRVTGGEFQDYELSVVPDYRRRGVVSYETAPLRRGRYQFKRTHCSTRDIFGLFEHKGSFEQALSVKVTPRTIDLRDWRMLRKPRSGMIQQRALSAWSRETTQIDGVREYIRGDRMSRIHWNATARTGEWKSKEYEREALPRVVVVLDRRAASYGASDEYELAVSAAASVLEMAARQSMPVGFVSAGRERLWFGVGRSVGAKAEAIEHLIDAEADGGGDLGDVLCEASERFEAGAYLIVVSPSTEPSLAKAMETLGARSQIAGHVHVSALGSDPDEGRRLLQWKKLLGSQSWECCSISRLEELPQAMEVGAG